MAPGPPPDVCQYVTTPDGVRLRVAVWQRGPSLVVVMPGRGEFIEKYHDVTGRLAEGGHSVAILDWRGQGLSDRLGREPMIGHVRDIARYRIDLDTLLAIEAVKDTQTRSLLSHSMGGIIALRALQEGLDAHVAIFSAPLWKLLLPLWSVVPLRFLAWLAPILGQSQRVMPGTNTVPYALKADPSDNNLTSHAPRFRAFREQIKVHPDLGIGGPSLGWINAIFTGSRRARRAPQPSIPILTLMGSREEIVCPATIRRLTSAQNAARLVEIDHAHHEVLFESPDIKEQAWGQIDAFLARHLP